jgi:hypothetical protein
MITNTTKKSTILQSSSISIKIVQGCLKVIKNHNWKKIDKDHNIIPNLLFTAIPIKIYKNSIINKMINSEPKTTM